jgi:glycosyltransferase involved in cell wall biosynthesis
VNLLLVSGDIALAQGRAGVFYETLRRLGPYWDRIDVLCPRAPGAAPRVVHGNVFVHPAPCHRALQVPWLQRAGGALLRERPYGLIVSHDYGVFYNGVASWLLSRRFGVPFVSEIHHVEGYPRAATFRERVYRGLAKAYIRWVRRRAVAIRTVNRHEVPELLRRLGVPEERILVLPSLYLDLDVFRPRPDEPKRYDVLFVGRLAANKGLPTILDAVDRVRRLRPGVRLGILGEGPLRPELDRRVAGLGHGANVEIVDRVATVSDVARVYARARMLVCASTAEGGPRVVVEAMACAVPVVSTPVGVVAELVRDGENGLLFRWDAGELAARIGLLLGDEALRLRLGEAGRQAVQGFEADAAIGRLASCYLALARAGERRP